jgi:hypothetical protein
VYNVGQYFQVDAERNGEIYLLVNTGNYATLVGIESGNRWTDDVHHYRFDQHFSINEIEFGVVTAGQPERFTPIEVSVSRSGRKITPNWEV